MAILDLCQKEIPCFLVKGKNHPWIGSINDMMLTCRYQQYNFVLSAAFSAGIAISGIVMLFSVQWAQIEISWWGNNQIAAGCEGTPCLLKELGEGERFFPWWNTNKIPAP